MNKETCQMRVWLSYQKITVHYLESKADTDPADQQQIERQTASAALEANVEINGR